MIIDAHTHINHVEGKSSTDLALNLKNLLAEIKKSKIDLALLIASNKIGEEHGPDTGEAVEITKNVPNIKVIGTVNVLKYSKQDLKDLESWAKTGQIVGIKFWTGYEHFYPSNKRCLPVYKICMENNIPAVFHSGDTLAGCIEKPMVKYSHPLQIDEVAAEYPNLKIVIAHLGNPWLIDCAEMLYKNPNVYADISGLIADGNLETPYGKVMEQRIKELIAYVSGSAKLIYGTDWPLVGMNNYINFAKKLGLNKTEQEELLYKNAVKAYNLKI